MSKQRVQELEAALLAAINMSAELLKPDECIDRPSAGRVVDGLRAVLEARVGRSRDQAPERIESAAWFAGQLRELAEDCRRNAREDKKNADECPDHGDRKAYEARAEDHAHYRKVVLRILAGKTFAEDLQTRIERTRT